MQDRLAKIKLLAMDVDGTLTDGSMIFQNGGQTKVFSVYDGLGIRLAMNHGLKIAWVTGNVSDAVAERARSLGVTDVYQGARYKSVTMDRIASDHGLNREEIAYMGDDLNDLPAFDRAGFRIAVSNAVDELKSKADMATQRPGGRGARREVIESIVKPQGRWEAAVESFLRELSLEDAGKQGPEAVA
jgi:3-deoxy-D-manno-octulosonate 8-phosphate phosphatase (KDO 8-P phosphatase)